MTRAPLNHRPVLVCAPCEPDAADALGSKVAALLAPRRATVLSVFAPHHAPVNPLSVVVEAILHVPAEYEEADRAAAQVSADAVDRALLLAGWNVEIRIERDARPPWSVALEIAEEIDAELIVVGAGQHHLRHPGALGAQTRALAHRTKRPLLVLPAPEIEIQASGPVLVAFDGSSASQHAMDVGAEILGPRNVVVTTEWTPIASAASMAAVAVPQAVIAAGAVEIDEAASEAASRTAGTGASRLTAAGWTATSQHVRGAASAWPALVAAADEVDASIILTGTRGHSRLTAALIGSVAEGLLRHSGRPVLLVPPPRGTGLGHR